MPLVHIKAIDECSIWALWKIEEELRGLELPNLCEQEKTELALIHNEKKRMEWLAARQAFQQICGSNNIPKKSVLKDGNGKPFLHGAEYHISLAHSFPFAVALINTSKPAGIDLERVQGKIAKISHKFLNEHEKTCVGNDLTKMTIVWCAKEALYKLYGRKKLIFKDNLFVDSFELQEEGSLSCRIAVDGTQTFIGMHYLLLGEYVVCYTL